MECVANTGASIRAFRISERQKNKLEFVAEMELSVGNKAHLDKVVSALKKLREVTNVLRTSERKR
jgi:(p)ppGpp synthase/HD superfamily hydrolase